MNIVIIALLVVLIVCVLLLFVAISKNKTEFNEAELSRNINDSTIAAIRQLGDLLSQNQKNVNEMQTSKFNQMNAEIKNMQTNVIDQLQKVYSGFGEMKQMAQNMTDLKKILSNVKTRGILGEIQLGAILEEILAPEQYAENVVTVPGSSARVEFAIRLPHNDEGFVYLPIDSKFPLDAYSALQDAQDAGDSEEIAAARKILNQRIRQFAKDIHTKYIEPPHTTDFAIMFLPIEGLYAEAVNDGLIETLQREYKVNITGPSTMAALLNSLQMGFKTLAIEKRSAEVWEILASVKTEFEKFDSVLESAKKHLSQTENDLENLIGTRSRAIIKKLNNIEKLDD